MKDRAKESDMPAELASPARRALLGAGITSLEQVSTVSKGELMQLHGIGRKAIEQLRNALADWGLSFAKD
jgi:DNA-directed RNA polymerase alpha subunit